MMTMVLRNKRIVALCIVAAWSALVGIRLADAYEDANERPDQIDTLIDQALATPAEQSTRLLDAQSNPCLLSTPILFSLPGTAESLPAALPGHAAPHLPDFERPPPRTTSPLFQVLSVYRL